MAQGYAQRIDALDLGHFWTGPEAHSNPFGLMEGHGGKLPEIFSGIGLMVQKSGKKTS